MEIGTLRHFDLAYDRLGPSLQSHPAARGG